MQASTHERCPARRYLQGPSLRSSSLHHGRSVAPGNSDRDKRHFDRTQPRDLGRRDNGMRVGLQALRGLGPKSDHAMARTLRWAWHYESRPPGSVRGGHPTMDVPTAIAIVASWSFILASLHDVLGCLIGSLLCLRAVRATVHIIADALTRTFASGNSKLGRALRAR
jgi:hypothetical protein